MSIWEGNFFAIPKSGRLALRFNMPGDDLGYYAKKYQMAAKIRVDQSDILRGGAFLPYFAESLMEIVLSYRLNNSIFSNESIELQDADCMQRAAALLVKDLRHQRRCPLCIDRN